MLSEIIVLAVLILLFLILYFIIYSSLKNLFSGPLTNQGPLKKFSIVVALKNESSNVKNLINSLANLNYPSSYYEVILVDDNSTDDTLTILNSSICDKPNFKVIRAVEKEFAGKKGALTIGIKNSVNPYIMITDADCTPGLNWLNAFSSKFDEYDVLFGIAPFREEGKLINRIACFENLRSSILTFAMANAGLPYSAAARSFGYNKDAFYLIGGYSKTVETPFGDDDLFLREAVKAGLRIGTVTNKDALVFSSAESTFKDYFIQKARHVSTSNHYLLQHKIFLGSWHLLNIAFLFCPLLSFISPYFLIPFSIKMLADLILVKKYQPFFGYEFNILSILFQQITYEFYLIVNYMSSIFIRKIRWK
jgi:cellulose synthase/poly-beta-1,6-N-acetylglucosamine synthase-like glycosyltransferase